MTPQLDATHGVLYALPGDYFGYFGWPTIARMDDGTLVAAASGLRTEHICPYGRTTFFVSRDEGKTWSSPRVIHDSPIDDRDAGVVCTGGENLLVSWFSTDPRRYFPEAGPSDWQTKTYADGLRWLRGPAGQPSGDTPTHEERKFQGSWVMPSDDAGETWGRPIRVPVTAPHGPIRLRSGELLYFGKGYGANYKEFAAGAAPVSAIKSGDGGLTWTRLGDVPLCEGTIPENYHEPHVVELPGGKLIGMIRTELFGPPEQRKAQADAFTGHRSLDFSVMQTESTDGGKTWTTARPTGFPGSPPHLLRHSSGALICVYGYRKEPYGERAAISRDDGRSWEHHVLRADGPDWDLGYPASVELSDGSVYTIYYQKPLSCRDKPAVLWTRWRVPG